MIDLKKVKQPTSSEPIKSSSKFDNEKFIIVGEDLTDTFVRNLALIKLNLFKECLGSEAFNLGPTFENTVIKYENSIEEQTIPGKKPETSIAHSLVGNLNKFNVEFSSGGYSNDAGFGGGGGQIGQFIPNVKGWNIQKAVETLVRNGGAKSKHQCAKYVRLAINGGGLPTPGNPVAACNYTRYLPTIGFQHIASLFGVSEQASWTSSNAQAGDISVMSHGQYGHICMYTGVQWISDFVQRKMWPYDGNGLCNIFRFKSK